MTSEKEKERERISRKQKRLIALSTDSSREKRVFEMFESSKNTSQIAIGSIFSLF
jgi:hypothetical protein